MVINYKEDDDKIQEKTINPLFIGLYLSDSKKLELSLLGSNNTNLPKTLQFNADLFKIYSKKNRTLI